MRSDDDDGSSLGEDSSQMNHSSGSRTELQNCASAKKQESSKEWMFEGSVTLCQFKQVKDGQIPDDEIPNFIRQNYKKFGEDLKLSISQVVKSRQTLNTLPL